MSKVEIKLDAIGKYASNQILVDGQDLANHVRGFKLVAGLGQVPQLILDLQVLDVSRIDVEQVELLLDPSVAALLERAGWTPPSGRTLGLEAR